MNLDENDPVVQAAARCRRYVTKYGKLYPDAWRAMDAARAIRGKDLPNWASWCFCPESIAAAIIEATIPSGENVAYDGDVAPAIGELTAIGAWRPGQGIYRFHPDIFDAILQQDLEGDIPAESLHRLPEWCCYVVTDPPLILGDDTIHPILGFFVYLENDTLTQDAAAGHGPHEEINFLVDFSDLQEQDAPTRLGGFSIPLVGTLDEAIAAQAQRAIFNMERRATPQDQELVKVVRERLDELQEHTRRVLVPLLQLTLYLCAADAEIDGERHPHKTFRKKRGILRMLPPDQPRFWEVAYRSGAALHAAKAYIAAHQGDGTHASPRPHLRKAHWHHYWVGNKADRRLALKWIAPVLVNLKGEAMVIPTIHEVEAREEVLQ